MIETKEIMVETVASEEKSSRHVHQIIAKIKVQALLGLDQLH